jgi:hypothetical protein
MPLPPTTSVPRCGIPDPQNPPVWIPQPSPNSPDEKYKRDADYCAKAGKKWADNYKKKHGKPPSWKDYLDKVQKCMESLGYTYT